MPAPAGSLPEVPATVTVDPTTDVGMVRLLITDLSETDPLLTDAQLLALLAVEGGVKLAAASALEVIARSEVLISKRITVNDLSTDGPAVAAELRASAKALRDQARDEAAAAEDWAVSVIDFDPNAAYRRW
ncbi:hypothetical protein [Micromonospora sp. NPDC049891]|uniref:hypothetical protein n=1 Tax=Micromonospora sp. NPDC049891 TaxID=3155655 RepID=UPI0033FB0009